MSMRMLTLAAAALAGVVCLAGAPVAGGIARAADAASGKGAAPPPIDNTVCLGCHGNEGFAVPGANGRMRSLHVVGDKFKQSVHGKRLCVECHKDITAIPHEKTGPLKVGCVQCHEDLWEAAKKENKTKEFARLGVVVEQIDHYMKSIHARPSREDQSRTNATCYNCHDAHYVYPPGSAARADWHLNVPNVCGNCHSSQRAEYLDSVHGRLVAAGNSAAPVCSDCHTTHDVDRPKLDAIKLVIVKNCGKCHSENLKSYANTYHGQVGKLGYAYTATCFDCHGYHGIQRVSHPQSTVHPNNRLQTCRKCHAQATAGFVTFQPHANTRDYDRYPSMWIASKFMIALLLGVFAFFWTHSALWFYREYRDRREGESAPHVATGELPQLQGKHFNRFGPVWRIAHLAFALSVMMLVLTGMAVLYAETGWAKLIMSALGGPRAAGIVHRVSAATLLGIFFVHLVYMAFRVVPKWKLSNWFGPTSLMPNWKDLWDMLAMFKWFFGKGPRPAFDRWTYWEKFDYWAVFWGMAIIGGSGVMLAFKEVTASVLPGWVFNVATLVHGEEAILAAVFLFTVHFFNNHFRPDKLPPPDIVMFTGTMALEEFRREHPLEYQRLAETGELARHLVDAPSRPMTLGSRVLGIALIAFGLILLILVLAGFLGSVAG